MSKEEFRIQKSEKYIHRPIRAHIILLLSGNSMSRYQLENKIKNNCEERKPLDYIKDVLSNGYIKMYMNYVSLKKSCEDELEKLRLGEVRAGHFGLTKKGEGDLKNLEHYFVLK